MEYADKIFSFLKWQMKPGEKIALSKLTKTPEDFINTVKDLIDNWGLRDIEFTSDYSHIRKCYTF
jgi:hypothetical protein